MKAIIAGLCACLFLNAAVYAEQESIEWKEARKACKGDWESPECAEWRDKVQAYCAENPDNKRCKKRRAMKACKENPDSDKCVAHKARIKEYCEQNPGAKKCVRIRVHKICKDDPESDECLSAKQNAHDHFCEKHPEHDKCT